MQIVHADKNPYQIGAIELLSLRFKRIIVLVGSLGHVASYDMNRVQLINVIVHACPIHKLSGSCSDVISLPCWLCAQYVICVQDV